MPWTGLTSDAKREPFEVCRADLRLLINTVACPSAQKLGGGACGAGMAVDGIAVGEIAVAGMTVGEAGMAVGEGKFRVGRTSAVGVGSGLLYRGSVQAVARNRVRLGVNRANPCVRILISFPEDNAVTLNFYCTSYQSEIQNLEKS